MGSGPEGAVDRMASVVAMTYDVVVTVVMAGEFLGGEGGIEVFQFRMAGLRGGESEGGHTDANNYGWFWEEHCTGWEVIFEREMVIIVQL